MKFKIGDEVVRSKGDYVVGRIGNVIEIDAEKQRARVQWVGVKTWCKFDVLELTSIPYEIIEPIYPNNGGRGRFPIYRKK